MRLVKDGEGEYKVLLVETKRGEIVTYDLTKGSLEVLEGKEFKKSDGVFSEVRGVSVLTGEGTEDYKLKKGIILKFLELNTNFNELKGELSTLLIGDILKKTYTEFNLLVKQKEYGVAELLAISKDNKDLYFNYQLDIVNDLA